MEKLPIADPGNLRTEFEERTTSIIEMTNKLQTGNKEFISWLALEFAIEKPGRKLESYWNLSPNEYVTEIRKRRPRGSPRLSPSALTELQKTHNEYSQKALLLKVETLKQEHRLSDLVNQAYGLSDEEIELLWRTVPPRMPISQSGVHD